MSWLLELGHSLETETIVFGMLLAITMLITLYAILMIHHKLRVLEGEIQAMKKDESVMAQEMEILAQSKTGKDKRVPAR